MTLSIDVRDEDGWRVVSVAGEIDIRSAPQLRERLNEVLDEGGTKLIVDLEGVDFMDSTALSVMVGAHKRLQRSGAGLVLVCTRPQLLRVLDLTGLARVFSVHPELAGALAS
jgi:anti-sigma B factor antagonist